MPRTPHAQISIGPPRPPHPSYSPGTPSSIPHSAWHTCCRLLERPLQRFHRRRNVLPVRRLLGDARHPYPRAALVCRGRVHPVRGEYFISVSREEVEPRQLIVIVIDRRASPSTARSSTRAPRSVTGSSSPVPVEVLVTWPSSTPSLWGSASSPSVRCLPACYMRCLGPFS